MSEITIHTRKSREEGGPAHTLYKTSSDFRAFIAVWVKEKRCPLPLVDFLLEHGLESQAECARWCATQPDRRPFSHNEFKVHGECGTYPWWSDGKGLFMCVTDNSYYASDEVPRDHIPFTATDRDGYITSKRSGSKKSRIIDVILKLLDVWIIDPNLEE